MNRRIIAVVHAPGHPESPRSPEWPRVKDEWLAEHPTCAACGGSGDQVSANGSRTAPNQVHHKQPYHLFPELELDPSNFITFCEECGGPEDHLHVGHLGNWENYNPNVEECAAALLAQRAAH
jgi:5-methylcytosine-specific restriction endonuclease McrA